jgi:choline dehydrogenase-like flavoprotein
VRARQLGGRMVVPNHGRQYYRLSPDDFACSDGASQPWPIRPSELDPWYGFVERRLGLAGMHDNVPWLPDSELSYVLTPTQNEAELQRAITARWPRVRPGVGRFSPPLDVLEAAAQTGRLLLRTGAIVREIEVDRSGQVAGVIWVDQQTRTEERAGARLVFLCASALESTRLLLLSRSAQSPYGLGTASGALGRYLMDHVCVKAEGEGLPLEEDMPVPQGRCLYLPRLDARNLPVPQPGPGFGVQLHQIPAGGECSKFHAVSFGEMLPRAENSVTLDTVRRDAWGIPVLRINCAYTDRELTCWREQIATLRELAELAGVTLTRIDTVPQPPGSAIHESGTARMGSSPKNSVLDPHNQCWEAQGLYVTDGACFPSQGSQNPTLTMLALTARACHHAAGIEHWKISHQDTESGSGGNRTSRSLASELRRRGGDKAA